VIKKSKVDSYSIDETEKTEFDPRSKHEHTIEIRKNLQNFLWDPQPYDYNYNNQRKFVRNLSGGNYYEGEVTDDGPDGRGIAYIQDGSIYEGYWRDGVF
jgi:hypothetical protein